MKKRKDQAPKIAERSAFQVGREQVQRPWGGDRSR